MLTRLPQDGLSAIKVEKSGERQQERGRGRVWGYKALLIEQELLEITRRRIVKKVVPPQPAPVISVPFTVHTPRAEKRLNCPRRQSYGLTNTRSK